MPFLWDFQPPWLWTLRQANCPTLCKAHSFQPPHRPCPFAALPESRRISKLRALFEEKWGVDTCRHAQGLISFQSSCCQALPVVRINAPVFRPTSSIASRSPMPATTFILTCPTTPKYHWAKPPASAIVPQEPPNTQNNTPSPSNITVA